MTEKCRFLGSPSFVQCFFFFFHNRKSGRIADRPLIESRARAHTHTETPNVNGTEMSTTPQQPQHNENVVLRVMAATTQSGVLLYDRTLAWQGVCAEGPGNAASLCTLVSSLGTLAHNMGEAPGIVTATETDAQPAAPAETGKKVMSVLFDNEAKVSGAQQQRSKTRRARRAVRDDTDTMPCVRLAIAQGQHVALSMFHLANPAPAMHAAGSAAALAQAVDAALCDAVVAFREAPRRRPRTARTADRGLQQVRGRRDAERRGAQLLCAVSRGHLPACMQHPPAQHLPARVTRVGVCDTDDILSHMIGG